MSKKSEIRSQALAALVHLREASSARTETEAEQHIADELALLGRAAGLPVRERDYTSKRRQQAAEDGAALSDGTYPIYNQEDADNAWELRNNSKSHSAASVVAHIRKRVDALGLKMPGSDKAQESLREAALFAVGRGDNPKAQGDLLTRALGPNAHDELEALDGGR